MAEGTPKEMTNLDKLKNQADDLGIKYAPNITEATLQSRITAHLESSEKVPDTATEEVLEMDAEGKIKLPEIKLIEDEIEVPKDKTQRYSVAIASRSKLLLVNKVAGIPETPEQAKARRLKQRQLKLKDTVKVIVRSNDKNESDQATTALPTIENTLGIAIGAAVPLDIPIELPRVIVNNLKEIPLQIHRPKIVKGKPDPELKESVTVKKYSISYV